jgi:hypothetical protein
MLREVGDITLNVTKNNWLVTNLKPFIHHKTLMTLPSTHNP